MAIRIVGVDLPQIKREVGLTYIYGIGRAVKKNFRKGWC